MASSKGLARKAEEATEGKRMLLLDQEKCKPNMPAFTYLQKHAGKCGGECIQVKDNRCIILEDACMACLNRAKHCPGDAVKIINLPTNLQTNITHQVSVAPRTATHRPHPHPRRRRASASPCPPTLAPAPVRHERLQAARSPDAARRHGARAPRR